jgi:hypothetical protein
VGPAQGTVHQQLRGRYGSLKYSHGPDKVLIDGASGLNVLFTKTLKKMKLDITHMLTKSTSPFYSIVLGNAAIPLGLVVLPVTFWETRENYRTEYIKF